MKFALDLIINRLLLSAYDMSGLKKRTIIRLIALTALFYIAYVTPKARCADENENISINTETAKQNQHKLSLDPSKKTPFESASSKDLYQRMLISIVMVCVLGAAAFYMSKKVLPKLANLQGKQIKVLETVHLGSRKSIHLIEFDNRRILIGSTSEQITKLADSENKPFSEHLEQEIGKS